MKTLRTNAKLILSNKIGGTIYTFFQKGTPLSKIAAEAASFHEWSVANSSHNHGHDIVARPMLVSEATGKPLSAVVPFTHAYVAPRCSIHALSPRQRQVYALRHMTNAEIATKIGVSELTVASYRNQAEYRANQLNCITL
jgi:hypothetical protein